MRMCCVQSGQVCCLHATFFKDLFHSIVSNLLLFVTVSSPTLVLALLLVTLDPPKY